MVEQVQAHVADGAGVVPRRIPIWLKVRGEGVSKEEGEHTND